MQVGGILLVGECQQFGDIHGVLEVLRVIYISLKVASLQFSEAPEIRADTPGGGCFKYNGRKCLHKAAQALEPARSSLRPAVTVRPRIFVSSSNLTSHFHVRMTTTPTIGFIGAGNMARSLAGGLIQSGTARERLLLADPDASQRQGAEQALGVATLADNSALAARAQVLVLAVKPQALKAVATGIAGVVQKTRPLVISIAAGIRVADLEQWLGGNLPIVRVMPNTAALIGSGASGLYANARVSAAQRDEAESILRAVGVTVWVEKEALIDTVTAVSGSGPAYFFLVMEVLEKAAIKHGLDPHTARLLTLETAYGAAKMALEGGEEPALLRKRVTSPGGTTEQAVKTLEAGQIEKIFDDAVVAAIHRAGELGDLFGKNSQ